MEAQIWSGISEKQSYNQIPRCIMLQPCMDEEACMRGKYIATTEFRSL